MLGAPAGSRSGAQRRALNRRPRSPFLAKLLQGVRGQAKAAGLRLTSEPGLQQPLPSKQVSDLARTMPEEIDLHALAQRFIDLVAILKGEVSSLLDNSRDLYVRGLRLLDLVSPQSARVGGPRALLEAAAETPRSKLYVGTLVYVAKGGTMEYKPIHQHAGRDVNAVIESYKQNTIAAGGSVDSTIEEQLRKFLEAVSESTLPDNDKKAVFEGTVNVSREVVKTGHLTGSAKLLWSGIKEVVTVLPKAVTAWEVLQRLWGCE